MGGCGSWGSATRPTPPPKSTPRSRAAKNGWLVVGLGFIFKTFKWQRLVSIGRSAGNETEPTAQAKYFGFCKALQYHGGTLRGGGGEWSAHRPCSNSPSSSPSSAAHARAAYTSTGTSPRLSAHSWTNHAPLKHLLLFHYFCFDYYYTYFIIVSYKHDVMMTMINIITSIAIIILSRLRIVMANFLRDKRGPHLPASQGLWVISVTLLASVLILFSCNESVLVTQSKGLCCPPATTAVFSYWDLDPCDISFQTGGHSSSAHST